MKKITNQKVCDELTKFNIFWGRKDANHIYVWTEGYQNTECLAIEEFLMTAGMYCLDRTFDNICGKTFSLYKHK